MLFHHFKVRQPYEKKQIHPDSITHWPCFMHLKRSIGPKPQS